MTIPESEFHKKVAEWLNESFEVVEHEVTIESGKRPDFIAHTPFHTYVIEVENTSDTLYRAIGQVGVYSVETGHDPVLVFPADADIDTEVVPEWVNLVRL